MKKFIITILCQDFLNEFYVDHIGKTFNTREEAQEQITKSIKEELECLNDTADTRYIQVNNSVFKKENDTLIEISRYEIKEICV